MKYVYYPTSNQSMTCTLPHSYEPNPCTPYERSHNFHHKDLLPDTISVAVPKPYTLGFCRHNMGRFKQSMLSPLIIWHPWRRHSIHRHIVDVLRRVQPNTDWLGLPCKFQPNTISSKLFPVNLPYMFSACRLRTDANTMKSRLLFSSPYNIRCILFKRLPKQCRISRIYKWKAVWRCSSSINTILQGSGFSIYLRKSPTGALSPRCPVNIPHQHHPSRTPLTSSTPLKYNEGARVNTALPRRPRTPWSSERKSSHSTCRSYLIDRLKPLYTRSAKRWLNLHTQIKFYDTKFLQIRPDWYKKWKSKKNMPMMSVIVADF